MGKKYMPKDVFEFGCATALYLHFSNSEDIAALSKEIWSKYRDSIIDDDVEKDINMACYTVISMLAEGGLAKQELATLFYAFSNDVKNYNPDGSKKKTKLLNGLFFQKSIMDPYRVNDFVKRFALFLMKVDAGMA